MNARPPIPVSSNAKEAAIAIDSPPTLSPRDIATTPILELVKHFEGFYARPYRCPAGVWTIGYGHTRGVRRNTLPVTEQQAEALLLADMEEAAMEVLKLTWWGVALFSSPAGDIRSARNRLAALSSFVFNLGAASLETSTLLRRIEDRRFDDAAGEMLRWNKARVNGALTVLPGLERRRKAEAHFFATGEVRLNF